ncbi:hypothetical protein EC957_003711, partial [Mortierella hygrophila]
AHPFFDPAQAAAFNALADKTDSSFEVRYFHLHGQGGLTRTLIVIGTNGHSRLTNVHEGDWADYKPTTPFGVMPLLTETSADGKAKLQVAESDAIERYLARKFELFGNGTAFEEVLVNTFANSTQGLIMSIFNSYGLIEDPAVRTKNKGPLISDNTAPWIKYHKQHLQANGANGHYVGNKVSLADVKTDYVGLSGEELVSEVKTPAILRLKKESEKVEEIAVWKALEEYKGFSEHDFAFLGFY